MPTGRDRLLRLGPALPDPPVGDITVLGVDDFAIKRGHHYGTVLIDCETRKAVDVLVGRDAEPVTVWLQEHTKPAVICRDRRPQTQTLGKCIRRADGYHATVQNPLVRSPGLRVHRSAGGPRLSRRPQHRDRRRRHRRHRRPARR
ncbi:transposase [Actinoplanes oblitus]|uniref:transposase n=1 Tax=Actinoplanes oblitus TaxID=3040509 RepID=UPI003899005B